METTTTARRVQPLRACRLPTPPPGPAAPPPAPPPIASLRAAFAPALPLDVRAMLARAAHLPAPVRALLAKQDGETVAFVGTCLSDLALQGDGARAARWMCQGRKRARVLVAVFEMLLCGGVRATVTKEEGLALYEVALAWETALAGPVPSIPRVYAAAS